MQIPQRWAIILTDKMASKKPGQNGLVSKTLTDVATAIGESVREGVRNGPAGKRSSYRLKNGTRGDEHRRDLTPSEKVEIGRRIEEALMGRNHRPAKSTPNLAELQEGNTDSNKIINMHPDLTPSEKIDIAKKIETETIILSPPQGESREIAAKAVGMKQGNIPPSQKVVESGNREI
ncbi:MAG: hypothetical protein A4E53_03858 [Pelotomaculum sp. PtaB.Bin104]|nr:MAG: hypothetical protein A4E53_03858 [Pelotomaculum sp. PtaB.Bin104]